MTTSDWRKALKQLRVKSSKMKKYIKHNAPKKRTTGKSLVRCKRCGRFGAHIGKYGLSVCRHCFREVAQDIGFRKYN